MRLEREARCRAAVAQEQAENGALDPERAKRAETALQRAREAQAQARGQAQAQAQAQAQLPKSTLVVKRARHAPRPAARKKRYVSSSDGESLEELQARVMHPTPVRARALGRSRALRPARRRARRRLRACDVGAVYDLRQPRLRTQRL